MPVPVSKELTKAVEELLEVKRLASMELGDHDRSTRLGMETMKAQAKIRLNDVTDEFYKAFCPTVYKLFAVGDREKIEKLSELLGRELPVFFTKSMYDELASLVAPTLSIDQVFDNSAYYRLVELLGDLARAYRVFPQNNPVQPSPIAITKPSDLVDVVKTVTRNAFGDELHKAFLYRTVVEQAMASSSDKAISVVVLPIDSVDERRALSETLFAGQPSTLVEFSENDVVDKSIVAKVYHRIYQGYLKRTGQVPETTIKE